MWRHLFFLSLASVILHAADDPGAPHEAAMKAAEQQAQAAARSLEKLVLELESEHVELNRLQTRHRQLGAERKELEQQIAQALAASEGYQQLRADRRELDDALRAAREADDQKEVQTLNQTRYKNHVAMSNFQKELLPAETARSHQLAGELRSTQRRLVLLATSELAEHPEVAPLLAARKEAQAAASEHRAAMFAARDQVTAIGYLATQPLPNFKPGHTLPPLTRYGWSQPFALRKAFADGWGYALELGGYITEGTLPRLDDPETDEAKTIALVNSDPTTYKLSVITARHFPEVAPEGSWTRDGDGHLLDAQAKSYDGTEWHPNMKTVISPLAPDALWEEMARGRAEPLAAVRERVPISIVLNGGEYGLGVLGFAGKVWRQDPRVVEAAEAEKSWYDYISKRKAHGEMIIAEAVRQAVPDRDLYIYYTTSGGGHRNRWPGWVNWAHGYEYMHPVSDLPSDEHYVNHFNSGWVGNQDVLSQALNSVGMQIAVGKPLAYSWFWCKRQNEEMRRYIGFLKCIYVMGTLGGNAGAYHQPDFHAGFKPEEVPYWVSQQIVLSRAHAFFSHLEDYLRHGDLLPGEYRHFWTSDNPAYELLPVELSDQVETRNGQQTLALGRPVRVLARQHQSRAECLVVAWAAEGDEREITVAIPEFGEFKLLARPGGSVYLITAGPSAHLLDVDQDFPSRSINLPATK